MRAPDAGSSIIAGPNSLLGRPKYSPRTLSVPFTIYIGTIEFILNNAAARPLSIFKSPLMSTEPVIFHLPFIRLLWFSQQREAIIFYPGSSLSPRCSASLAVFFARIYLSVLIKHNKQSRHINCFWRRHCENSWKAVKLMWNIVKFVFSEASVRSSFTV